MTAEEKPNYVRHSVTNMMTVTNMMNVRDEVDDMGYTDSMAREEKIKKVIEISRSLIGTPYKYGAKIEEAPSFFDCSGFVKYVFGQVGIELPRSTVEQIINGTEVSLENLKRGDLIFMHGTRGHYNPKFPEGIGHVGIYSGDQTVITTRSKRISDYPDPIVETGGVIEVILNEFLSEWAPLVKIKRVL